jgi:hypothetical protein
METKACTCQKDFAKKAPCLKEARVAYTISSKNAEGTN